MAKSNKTAKDLAFEKEQNKLRHKINEQHTTIIMQQKTIQSLQSELETLKTQIATQNDWIERLLEYTELSKDDLKTLLNKAKTEEQFNKIMTGFFRNISLPY